MEQRLRDRIEEVTLHAMKTPRDFAWLSERIGERTKLRVSSSTLRRFWGITNEGVKASAFTKDVLAKYLGYQDFEQFADMQGDGDIQSQPVIGEKVSSDDLYEGEMLKISWLPNRMCIIRYDGVKKFTIVKASNTCLAKGDTFECPLFINREPAYLDKLVHGGKGALTYVIGKKNGIFVERYVETN